MVIYDGDSAKVWKCMIFNATLRLKHFSFWYKTKNSNAFGVFVYA